MAIINPEPQIYEYTEGQAANAIVGTHSIFYSGGTITSFTWAMAGGPDVTTSMNYKVEEVSNNGSELVLRYLLTPIGATSNMNNANVGLNVETNRIQIILDASPVPVITDIDIEFRVTNITETTNPITTASRTTIAPTTIPPTTIAPTTVSPMTTVTPTTGVPTTTVSSTSSAPSTTVALCDSTNSARIVRYWNFILK